MDNGFVDCSSCHLAIAVDCDCVRVAGFMMSSFEVGDCEGIKAEPGLEGGMGLPFAGLEDTPLAALHHLHQVSLSCLTVDCTYHHAFIHPLTHSLVHSLTHLSIDSLNHSLICFQAPLCSCFHLLPQLVNLWPIPAFVDLMIRSLLFSCICSLI